VPDITCPAIEDVIKRLDTLSNTTKRLTTAQNKILTGKLEKLRRANEQLRASGQYWHDACQSVIEKHIRKKTNK
jgi:FtsZ-binding cell division protein ZapB